MAKRSPPRHFGEIQLTQNLSGYICIQGDRLGRLEGIAAPPAVGAM